MKNIADYLEKPHVEAMLQIGAIRSMRDYLMLRLLWRTGMRIDELRNMRPADIEPQNKVVNITKAKGGKMRRIPLDPETITLCRTTLRRGLLQKMSHFATLKQWIRGIVHR
ncbi:MAG: tyrosine-type recombinase/integrase, partial [Halobacteriota archaeon]